MRKKQASITALGIALIRALERARPPDQRVCDDPYARHFIPSLFYWLGRFFTAIGYLELRAPGVQGFIAARERYIDDLVQVAFASNDFRQLVILGAGYDSRAYRFGDLLSGVQVFEVDHPVTQADKRKKLEKLPGRAPAHLTFVSIDFNQQPLAERLLACGYSLALRTLFIWQGVTYYLTPQAVDETLAFIANQSAPGSRIVFDYIDRSALEGRGRHGEVDGMRRYRWLTGEDLAFGIPGGEAVAFLEARGFGQVNDVYSPDLHKMYFTGQRRGRKVVPGYGIASAVVLPG